MRLILRRDAKTIERTFSTKAKTDQHVESFQPQFLHKEAQGGSTSEMHGLLVDVYRILSMPVIVCVSDEGRGFFKTCVACSWKLTDCGRAGMR